MARCPQHAPPMEKERLPWGPFPGAWQVTAGPRGQAPWEWGCSWSSLARDPPTGPPPSCPGRPAPGQKPGVSPPSPTLTPRRPHTSTRGSEALGPRDRALPRRPACSPAPPSRPRRAEAAVTGAGGGSCVRAVAEDMHLISRASGGPAAGFLTLGTFHAGLWQHPAVAQLPWAPLCPPRGHLPRRPGEKHPGDLRPWAQRQAQGGGSARDGAVAAGSMC